jgi:hypothetical protein
MQIIIQRDQGMTVELVIILSIVEKVRGADPVKRFLSPKTWLDNLLG